MIYGSDSFIYDKTGKRWQKCLCGSKRPGVQFAVLVPVYADEGNRYHIEPFDDFDARIVGTGKDLMVVMNPKGTVVVLEEKPA